MVGSSSLNLSPSGAKSGEIFPQARISSHPPGKTDKMVTYLDAATAPLRNTGQIRLYGEEGFAGMRKACELTARCLDELVRMVEPGVTTEAIDRFVFEFGMDHGALPATLNYRGYTKSSCTSINHVVCHGIPDDKPLRDGDIVNIDVTYILDGWHGDSSRMYPVGTIKRAAERLLEVTHECLMRGIARDPARRPHRRHRRGDPDLCRSRALLGGARFLRPRRRPALPRCAEHPALWQRRRRRRDAARHDLHHRADDQSRPAACESAVGRLDGGDPRPLAVGAVRAYDRRHRRRLRDLHAVAEGLDRPGLPA